MFLCFRGLDFTRLSSGKCGELLLGVLQNGRKNILFNITGLIYIETISWIENRYCFYEPYKNDKVFKFGVHLKNAL